MYELGLYEKSMPNTLSFKEKLETVKATGFDFLEMSVDETDEKLARLKKNVLNLLKQCTKQAYLFVPCV